ncbi:MAG: ATP-binding cassette domain-containing protein [Candidatus Vogelbacteria bacterium]|nr:ATP-binding cassette domain-containing protein [Candidatus Vogelbacteria bacterium]
MDHPIIEIKNVGKKYNITHQRGRYVALRDVITSIIMSPFSFLKKKVKQVAGLEVKEEFWALRNINLDVKKGEVIGIIGRNGAGKSTLLKILSQITPPTMGEIKIHGRVGSLLEVGTGFHPELTGRENIFLNGAILGMKQKEIARKFDAIVEFAGIEKFIDTPVKYYSSGMYVRLAFSVAAHMEPDILIVDEVLAVGDAEFQKKCLGKMEEVTRQDGRTILFVSHNLGAIQNLCSKTVLLEKGTIKMIGETREIIETYLENMKRDAHTNTNITEDTKKDAQITSVKILDKNNVPSNSIPISEKFSVIVDYIVRKPLKNASLSCQFYLNDDYILISSASDKSGKLFDYQPGKYTTIINIPEFLFNVGFCSINVLIDHPMVKLIDTVKDIGLEITNINNPRSNIYTKISGKMGTILEYETKKMGSVN